MLPPGETMAPASRNSQHLCLSALNTPPEWGMRLRRPQPSLINCLLGKRSHFFPAVLPLISCPCFSSLPPCSGKLLQLNSVSPKKKEKGIKVEEKLAGGKGGKTEKGRVEMQIHYIRTFFKNKDRPSFCKVSLGSLTHRREVFYHWAHLHSLLYL